ncbi:MAG: flagellar biosynthesis anti-sigma factor FlgM [Gammaproteobacteria bacterium]|nr:flagellar biosynthesis anti-sigma factor FlgM [Gammaproteobacteria bacterium]
MSIDINNITGRPVRSSDSRQSSRVSGGKAGASETTAEGGGDHVSLTDTASQLQQLETQIASLPVVDSATVSDIQRSLATGEFSFEPEDAAENLLEQERALASVDTSE